MALGGSVRMCIGRAAVLMLFYSIGENLCYVCGCARGMGKEWWGSKHQGGEYQIERVYERGKMLGERDHEVRVLEGTGGRRGAVVLVMPMVVGHCLL